MDLATIFLFNNLQKIKYLAKTGISVDIHNLGKNTRCLAVKEAAYQSEIYPGVNFKKHSAEFSKGNFTNIYDLSWDLSNEQLVPEITSSHEPYFLSDHMQSQPSLIATINGAFFFLSDIADREPVDLPYNFCIRNGQILGLPSSDEPVAYIKNNQLFAQSTQAQGSIKIGKKILKWVGAQSKKRLKSTDLAILFNSRCCNVVKSRDPQTNIQIGVLDTTNITTPQDKNLIDIVVGVDTDGQLIITEINPGGGTHFFAGNLILQIKQPSWDFKIGDVVYPLTLDGLDLSVIQDALTIGKSIDDGFFEDDIRSDRKDARSVLAQDTQGRMHFITFDGSKYVPGFLGVSAVEIQDFFNKAHFKWAYFLDGGGSTRIVVREAKKLQSYANQFAFQKYANGRVKWDWEKSRKITSSIGLHWEKKAK